MKGCMTTDLGIITVDPEVIAKYAGTVAVECFGIVGESGCGKSTLGRVILRLHEATSGDVLYDGMDINNFTAEEMRHMRQNMQIIFQDPYASLNPRMTIGQIIEEPLILHKVSKTAEERRKRVEELMELVGLPLRSYNQYPHEFDGGRRQRVVIARALSINPQFIVCDEPVSALDVSVQAQILNLLMDLQEKMGLTYMFITHDLSVVKHISTNIGVMYLGQLIEKAPKKDIFEQPLHPYTIALLSAIPSVNVHQKSKKIIHLLLCKSFCFGFLESRSTLLLYRVLRDVGSHQNVCYQSHDD